MSSPRQSPPPPPLRDSIPYAHWIGYRIGRGEQGVLTFEPYKSALLPHWRFRTVPVARRSAATLWARFEAFAAERDFVGMDMARKFAQMGMTRARRYANHAGGRKYRPRPPRQQRGSRGPEQEGEGEGAEEEKEKEKEKEEKREELPRSTTHADHEEKAEAARIFREVWDRCRAHEGYRRLKEEFLREQAAWEKQKKTRDSG
ncbi:hypothetical protein GGR56DRAFT_409437 [Xylariaceae sp. FL0804]|nr:hypothetical protein GGR56DRAFT_409437 [Xylariaceae sp. FL0804]